jgi:hypothetical protein
VSQISLYGILAGDTISRLRFDAAGSFIDGYWTEPADNITRLDNIKASVQPVNRLGSVRLQQKYEGTRIQDWRVVYCSPDTLRELKEKEGIKEDHVLYNGEEYVVTEINHWRGQAITHDQAFIRRVDEGESWYKPTEVAEAVDV